MSGDERFAYDSYRRFIQMYSSVVLGIGHHHFEDAVEYYKEAQAASRSIPNSPPRIGRS